MKTVHDISPNIQYQNSFKYIHITASITVIRNNMLQKKRISRGTAVQHIRHIVMGERCCGYHSWSVGSSGVRSVPFRSEHSTEHSTEFIKITALVKSAVHYSYSSLLLNLHYSLMIKSVQVYFSSICVCAVCKSILTDMIITHLAVYPQIMPGISDLFSSL